MGWPSHDKLTDADRALLERLCRGERPKQIAFDMGVGAAAVSQRLRRVSKILGASTRDHAIALYLAPEKYRKP